jgi:polar amino acid transport system permease protein
VGLIISALAGGVVLTLEITVGSWFLSTVLGLLLASMIELRLRVCDRVAIAIVDVLRSLPELLVLYLVFFGLGAGGVSVDPLVASIIAIGVGEAGFTAEIFRAGLSTVALSQRDAGLSMGMAPGLVYRRIVLPQVVPFVTPPLVNSFAALLKVATLASAIGVNEVLGRSNILIANTGHVTEVLSIVVVIYLILCLPLSELVAYLERRLRRRLVMSAACLRRLRCRARRAGFRQRVIDTPHHADPRD